MIVGYARRRIPLTEESKKRQSSQKLRWKGEVQQHGKLLGKVPYSCGTVLWGAQLVQTNQLEAETTFSEAELPQEKFNGADNTTSKQVCGIWQS